MIKQYYEFGFTSIENQIHLHLLHGRYDEIPDCDFEINKVAKAVIYGKGIRSMPVIEYMVENYGFTKEKALEYANELTLYKLVEDLERDINGGSSES